MKKNYTFLEAILYVCFMPSIKKVVLPLLIVLSASLTVFVKIMESGASTTLVKENIFLNNELNFENTLQAQAGNTNNIEHTINELVAKGNMPEGALYSNLIDIEIALEQMSPEANETSSSVQYAFYVNLLKRKLALYKSTFNAQQINNIEGAARIIGSPDLRNINDSLKMAAIKLKSDATALSAAVVPSMNVQSKKVQSWGFLVYLFGIIFCLLVYLYVYVKGRLSSESETKVKASAAVKENFLANMSHEIRTPLNAILGFTSILQKTKLENEQKDYVDIIQRSGDNLLSIVNDILDLSKIEAGMLRIEEAPFRVSDIISTVETMLSPRAEEKKLKLFVNLDVDVPEIVSGDAVRLTQILVNLVSNSIKFTEDGGVYLRVTMLKMENNTAKLEFLVRDTGIGIPAEKQLTIFDRFEQAEAETTRRFGGTGLGLSIVKNLVELQKGTITLFSNEGHGSSFTVELSFKICEGERTVREIKRHVAISDNNKSGIRILIAEDNSMNQRLIRHLLKSRGYNFDLVFNGVQAIESLKKQSYDMVLMDIQMPEMDGYSATRQIREELKSTIPVIAMTAHAMSGEREKCIKSGMNDYISKPINEEILFDIIQKYSSPGSFYGNESQSENNGGKIIGIIGNDNNAQAV
jgi:signal transduction histidine kinase/CheY-like chemotaxis protein